MVEDNIIQDFVNTIKSDQQENTKTYLATVSRVESDGSVFVRLAGSDIETPTAMTSAEVSRGDIVNVEWRNNKLYVAGNSTNPSVGVIRVEAVEQAAEVAREAAANAVQFAVEAHVAAEDAKATADAVHGIAVQARQDASDAKTAAGTAQTAADNAMVGLSTVEDVVGVLNWITEHGTMTSQSGGTFVDGQVYFVQSAQGDYVVNGTHYAIVPEPVATDINSYYVLSVDESVQNYVATHVAVDTEGLWIIPDAGGNKVLIATGSGSTYTTAGTYIVGAGNVVLASFTASGAQIGRSVAGNTVLDSSGVSIKNNGTTLSKFTTSGIEIGQTNGKATINSDGLDFSMNSYSWFNVKKPSRYGATITETFTGDGVTTSYQLKYPVNMMISVKVNDTSVGYQSTQNNYGLWVITPYSTPASGSTIKIEYDAAVSGTCLKFGSVDNPTDNWYSSSIGRTTESSGYCSTALNRGTKATKLAQTAIGAFNSEPTDEELFIIGNGTGDNARSNALTVDWSGNVEAAGDVTDGAGNTLSVLCDKDAGRVTVNYSGNGVSASSGTWKDGGGKTLTPGIWVVAYGVGFASNANGNRIINFGTSVGDGGRYSPAIRAASGADTRVVGIRVINVATSATYKVSGLQNSGSALTMYPWFDAVCVKPFLS